MCEEPLKAKQKESEINISIFNTMSSDRTVEELYDSSNNLTNNILLLRNKRDLNEIDK